MHIMCYQEKKGDKRALFFTLLSALTFIWIFTSPGLAYGDTVYVDSQQHFTIQIPPGWVAKPYSAGGASGVTIVHGADAYVQIFLQKEIDPATFLQALNNEIQTTHAGYHVSDRGLRTISGQPRIYIVGEAPGTSGAPRTRVYLETFAANGFSYAVIASSSGSNPQSPQSISDYKISQAMIQSLTLNGVPAKTLMAAGAVPGTAAAPAATAANSSDNPPLSPRDRKKLAALDTALKGGAITAEEYQVKKNALYSNDLRQHNTLTVRKALDQAYEDGVLTKDEYDRKKRELVAVGTPPVTSANSNAEPPSQNLVEVRIAAPQPETLPKSWTTHKDPAGFVVNLPANWTVGKVSSNGQVVLHGTRGEEILIWPLHLQQSELDAQGAAAMVQELARKFDALMPWSSVQTMTNATRVMGMGAEHSGSALLSWANGPGAASVCFYGIEAPGEVYRDSTDSFAAILKSFHVVSISSNEGVPEAANGSSAGELSFVDWSDPHEKAFTVSVPQGWQAIGGGYRLSPVDARYSIFMVSPDGLVRTSMGDSLVGAFLQPTQALSAARLGEGTYQTLADGTKLEVLGYNSGKQFAQSYVRTLLSGQCSDPQVNSADAREDLASAFARSAAVEGFTDAHLTAGEVAFTCNVGGRPLKGKYIAATIRMASGDSAMWFVYRLYGYVAFTGREQDGEKVLAQMVESSKFNPEWETRQRDAASTDVRQENDSSRQIYESAQENVADDQRLTSEMIAHANEQLTKIADEIDRKREDSIVGRLDVIDPQTGTQYKVAGFEDYHSLNNDGYLYSLNPLGAPGSNLRAMIVLP